MLVWYYPDQQGWWATVVPRRFFYVLSMLILGSLLRGTDRESVEFDAPSNSRGE